MQGKEVGAAAPKPAEQVTPHAKPAALQEAGAEKVASPGAHSLHVEDASKGGASQQAPGNPAPVPLPAETQPISPPIDLAPAAEAPRTGLVPLEAAAVGPSGREEPGQGAVDGRTPPTVEVILLFA